MMPKKFDKVQKEITPSVDVVIPEVGSMLNQQTNPSLKEIKMNETTVIVTEDTPVVMPTEVLKRGRLKGTKVENIVKAADFVPKYRELVAQGKSIDEIATEFKLGKMTIVQKRLSYNKASAEAGHPLNLPLPKSTGTRGGKKIDWAAFSKKIEDTINV